MTSSLHRTEKIKTKKKKKQNSYQTGYKIYANCFHLCLGNKRNTHTIGIYWLSPSHSLDNLM